MIKKGCVCQKCGAKVRLLRGRGVELIVCVDCLLDLFVAAKYGFNTIEGIPYSMKVKATLQGGNERVCKVKATYKNDEQEEIYD